MTQYEGLIERLKSATGPDRGLDAEIDAALFGGFPAKQCHDSTRRSYGAGYVHNADDGSNLTQGGRNAPWLTASIEACAALVAQKLPARWEYQMGMCGEDDMPWASITEPDEPCRDFAASAPTIPLAMIEALLLALQGSTT